MRTGRISLLLPLPAFILIQACAPEIDTGHTFQRYAVADTLVAATSGGPRYEGDLFRYEPVTVLKQDPDRPSTLMFPDIRFLRTEKGFFRGQDGCLFVGDSGNARIAVFDPGGNYLRSIGRRGAGPGEFALMELYDLSGDTLTTIDHNQHRTTRYRTDGSLLEVLPRRTPWEPEGILISLSGPSHYDEQGYLWMGAGFTARTARVEPLGEARTRRINILYAIDTPGIGRGGQSRPPVPFVARPFARPMPDGGIVLTDTVEPVLWWYNLDGSVRLKIETGIPRRRITEADVRRFYDDLEARTAVAEGLDRELLILEREAVPFPEYGSLWNHLSVDDAGCLWLEAHELEFERADRGGGYTYYVISPEGEFLGTTRAPGMGRVRDGHLMGEIADPSTGTVTYAVWRLVPLPPGFAYPPAP